MSLRPRITFLVTTLLVSCSLVACGGDPPEKEMQQAETAITAAQAAGADRYAGDEFKAAQASLTQAHEAVTARDYRLALDRALDSRERALTAAAQASAAMAGARTAADTAISGATTALGAAKASVSAAEASRAAAKTLPAMKAAFADAEAELQKARAAWEAKDFDAALTAANAVTARLAEIAEDSESAAASGRRRR